MAITFTAGATKDTNTDASVYTTDSAAVTSGDLILCWIYSEGGTTPDTPSVSGTNGFNATYTLIAGDDDCGAVLQMFAFWAVASSSTSGTISFTFTDDRVDNIVFGYFFEQGGNTAAPIVASQAGLGDHCVGSGTFSNTTSFDNFDSSVRQGNTLAAITAGNAVVLIAVSPLITADTLTIDSGWTNGVLLQEGPDTPNTGTAAVGYEVGGTPTNTPDITSSVGINRGMGVAFELAVAVAGDNAATSLDTIRTYQIRELVKP